MDEEGNALKKRKRDNNVEDSDTLDAAAKPLKRGKPFFDDGNVVLIAERTCFKVYQGILSEYSEVFRDMFSLPQPADVERLDGCPVVHLQDSPTDLARILIALYHSANAYFIRENSLSFEVVSTMLRLGFKYQIEHIREEAIRRLKLCFPDVLKDFRTHHTVCDDEDDSPYFLRDGASEFLVAHSIAAICLARTYNIPCLLGPAFYTCAHLDHGDWLEGFADEDGNYWKLSSEDLRKCMDGERALREAHLRSVAWLFPPQPSPHCRIQEKCRAGLTSSANRLRVGLTRGSDVLVESTWIDDTALGVYEDVNEPRGFCQTCAAHFKSIYDEERMTTWRNLGSYFGLDELPDHD